MAPLDPAFMGPAHQTDMDAYSFDVDTAPTQYTFVTDGGKVYIDRHESKLLQVTAFKSAGGGLKYAWPYIMETGLFGAGALTSGQVINVCSWGNQVRLELEQSGGDLGKYIWRVYDEDSSVVRLSGTTLFSRGTYQEIRIDQDRTNWTLWVDGVNEGSAADINVVVNTQLDLASGPSDGTNNDLRYRGMGIRMSADEADRPDVSSITYGACYPGGNDGGSGQNQYSDTACSAADDNGDYTEWDDWASGSADDATSFNCGPGGTAEREISTLVNVTVANVASIYVRARMRASLATKTVQTFTIERDGSGNEQEKANDNVTSDNWRTRVGHYFDTDPNGDPWNQTRLDALRLGVRTLDTNGANDQWTAIFAEAWGMTTDPPPVATSRRRAHVQFI